MGRKRNAPTKLKERARVEVTNNDKAETTVTPVSEAQLEPNNGIPPSERLTLLPESSKQPVNSTLDELKTSLLTKGNLARETPDKVRRSERLRTSTLVSHSQDIKRVIEEITLSESEKEDEPMHENFPEPTSTDRNLDEKIEDILNVLQLQQKTIDALKYKVNKNSCSESSIGVGDITYKSLYIDSQKKVEALMEENYQLNMKLQNALGKIEAYEKGSPVVCEVLEKLNEVLFSRLPKTAEAAVNVLSSSEAGLEHGISTKKKRLVK